jgi:uncharacterized protein YxjI
MRTCAQEGCKTHPNFDIKGGKGRFCIIHKTAEMVNVKSKRCEYEGCDSLSPNFDIKGGKGRFCGTHKMARMVDVKHKRCEHYGCDSVNPSFDIKGGKGRFCKIHKTSEMVDVKNKRCEHEGCDSQPAFGIKGGKERFCGTHKMAGMVDVKSKRCEHEGCDSLNTAFDIKGGKGRFCKIHKTAGMMDVKTRRCEYEGCDIIKPAFGIKRGKGRFCKIHKTAEMVDVKSKRCEHDGCDSISTAFDIKGGKGRFCGTHKTAEMMNIKHKRCEHEDCTTHASYGKPGNPRSHCAKHRHPGMIKRPNGKCVICKEHAIYGTNLIPKHCEDHKTEEDQNLVEQECTSCRLVMVLDKHNKCEYCNPEAFKAATLAKQNALMDYLDARGLPGTSTDVMVNNGECGRERPDRVYEYPDRVLIMECDEHQHQYRQCVCEQTRMINIAQGYGGLPVYFIRWNPDDYIPANDKKEPELLAKRHKLAADVIRDIQNRKMKLPNSGLVFALYLYYDEWDGLANESWKVLMELDE